MSSSYDAVVSSSPVQPADQQWSSLTVDQFSRDVMRHVSTIRPRVLFPPYLHNLTTPHQPARGQTKRQGSNSLAPRDSSLMARSAGTARLGAGRKRDVGGLIWAALLSSCLAFEPSRRLVRRRRPLESDECILLPDGDSVRLAAAIRRETSREGADGT